MCVLLYFIITTLYSYYITTTLTQRIITAATLYLCISENAFFVSDQAVTGRAVFALFCTHYTHTRTRTHIYVHTPSISSAYDALKSEIISRAYRATAYLKLILPRVHHDQLSRAVSPNFTPDNFESVVFAISCFFPLLAVVLFFMLKAKRMRCYSSFCVDPSNR